MNYASFWKRAAAYLVDCFIVTGVSYPIQIIVTLIFVLLFGNSKAATLMQQLFSLLLSATMFVAYYVWTESTVWQATVGKRIFNLKVTDLNGQRLTFLRSLGRNAGKLLSGFLLGIGFLFCLWTEKKQCMHDLLADCLVIDQTPQEKTGCVVAVLVTAALLIVSFILILGLFAFAIAHGSFNV